MFNWIIYSSFYVAKLSPFGEVSGYPGDPPVRATQEDWVIDYRQDLTLEPPGQRKYKEVSALGSQKRNA